MAVAPNLFSNSYYVYHCAMAISWWTGTAGPFFAMQPGFDGEHCILTHRFLLEKLPVPLSSIQNGIM
jgi:hypothetical protein